MSTKCESRTQLSIYVVSYQLESARKVYWKESLTKKAAKLLVSRLEEFSPKLHRIRLKPSAMLKASNLVQLCSLQVLRGKKVSLFNDGEPKVQPLTARDVKRLHAEWGEIVDGKWSCVVDGVAIVATLASE